MRGLGRALGVGVVAGWLGVLLLVVLSASCGHQYFLTGTEIKPTPTSSSSATASTSPTATPTAGLVFATNNGDGTLSEFSRDLTSGALTLIGTTSAGAAPGPTGLALSPSNGFLYVYCEIEPPTPFVTYRKLPVGSIAIRCGRSGSHKFDSKARDPGKASPVTRDEQKVARERRGGDHQVALADHTAGLRQPRPDSRMSARR